MRVEELMTTKVETVSPATSLKEVAATLSRLGISGLPVVDANGRVLGVVSEADILRREQGPATGHRGILRRPPSAPGNDGRGGASTAGEAMTSPAICIPPERLVHEAARLMVERKINRLPVVSGERLVGIVTRADLVRAFTRSDEEIRREIADDVVLHTLWLDPSRISISVANGEVALAGETENRTDAELIVAFAQRVPGVIGVRSELTWEEDEVPRRRATAQLPRRV